RLELVVADDDADRLAQHLAAEIVDRHLRGGDRALTGRRRCRTVHVGEDADLDHVVGNLRERGGRRQHRGREYSQPGKVPGEHPVFSSLESARWLLVFRRRFDPPIGLICNYFAPASTWPNGGIACERY